MGIASATLAGLIATSAEAWIPKWGCWYADAAVDGDHDLSGSVDLKIADLTLKGTILSGGKAKGRSHFRIVGGKGGWGKTIRGQGYSTDSGVKASTVLLDAAAACGETIDASTIPSDRLGSSFTREEGPASMVLEHVAPAGWYVGEDGVTRIGSRPKIPYVAPATHGPVDLARGTVTLAAESIANILPGITVDGLEAVDVQHSVSAGKGLRSTVYGKRLGDTSQKLAALQAVMEQLDPDRKFRGVKEYRVVSIENNRLNLQPVRVRDGMPDLRRIHMRPGVSGCYADPALGSRVLVGFIDADRGRAYVDSYEEFAGEGFTPSTLKFHAAAQVAGEHVATVEANALLLYNTLVILMSTAGGGPLLAVTLQPLLGAAILAALTAQAAPAPPGEIAQNAASALQLSGFATGVAPATTSEFFNSVIALLAGKTPNVSGKFPSLGSAAVEAG